MLRHSDSSQPAASSRVPRAGLPPGNWAGGAEARRRSGCRNLPVGQVGGVQVVVEEPAYGLPLPGPGAIFRGARGRIAVDEVMEAELSAGDLGQQVIIQQGDERLLRLGEGTTTERTAGVGRLKQAHGLMPSRRKNC